MPGRGNRNTIAAAISPPSPIVSDTASRLLPLANSAPATTGPSADPPRPMPITRLAAVLRISRTTAQARLDRLLESGAVLGFTIRARQSNDQVRAVMMIEIEGRSTTAIIKRLRGFPELAALHTTNGGWDLVAEITAASLADFDRILREVRQIEGVLNSETSLLLSSL